MAAVPRAVAVRRAAGRSTAMRRIRRYGEDGKGRGAAPRVLASSWGEGKAKGSGIR